MPKPVSKLVNSDSRNGEGNTIYWAFQDLPPESATGHFLVIGSTGSGKTTIVRLLMGSVIPMIGEGGQSKRALVYDGKREYVSAIYGMKPKCPVFIFNPFDSRTHVWDISADVTAARHASAIAAILIPDEPNTHQRFFPDAARALLATVMTAFAIKAAEEKEKGGWRWTFRDVILTLRSAERIREVVALDALTEDMAMPYLEDERTMPAIISTLATKLGPFEVVAALWEKALKERNDCCLSLSDWIKSESILVLSGSPSNRPSIDPIIQVIFKRLSDLLLESENTMDELSWIFLDEAREAGKLDGLSSLMNQGRSKGLSVVLGFQEIEGIEHVYSPKVAGEICGQCAHKTFLRTNSQVTAKWVQDHCGEVQQIEAEESTSEQFGQGYSHSESIAFRRVIRHVVMAPEVMELPRTGPKTGLTAIHDVPDKPLEKTIFGWKKVMARLGSPSEDPQHADYVPWKEIKLREELITLWNAAERRRLGIGLSPQRESQKTVIAASREPGPARSRDQAPLM